MIKSILSKIGIYGYSRQNERAMLASLLTGTPLLLIGRTGEAKTQVARLMAELILGVPKEGEPAFFQKVDAPKATFEDIIGFPNPASYSEGKIEYALTPISIMNKKFILVDEISRCNLQTQNKFFEIILERQVQGIQTDVLWVWATMNPLEYPGSQPLDEALAGRMGFIIKVEELVAKKGPDAEELLHKAVMSRDRNQTPARKFWAGEERDYRHSVPEEVKTEVAELLSKATTILNSLDDVWSDTVSKYVTQFARVLHNQTSIAIDTRRCVMIKNNIISALAIETAQQGRAIPLGSVSDICIETLLCSLPWIATAMEAKFNDAQIRKSHQTAALSIIGGDPLYYQLATEQDPVEKVHLFLSNRAKISGPEAANLMGTIYDYVPNSPDKNEAYRQKARIFFVEVALGQLLLSLDRVPIEAISIAAKRYPVDFSLSRAANPKKGSMVATNLAELDTVTNLYSKLLSSSDIKESLIGYLIFRTLDEECSGSEIGERYQIAVEELEAVTAKLRPFYEEAKRKLDVHKSTGQVQTAPATPAVDGSRTHSTASGSSSGPPIV